MSKLKKVLKKESSNDMRKVLNVIEIAFDDNQDIIILEDSNMTNSASIAFSHEGNGMVLSIEFAKQYDEN